MSKMVVAGLALLLASDLAAAQGGSVEPAGKSWIFSEMQSPLDYAPVIIASAWSAADADGRTMQLSIQCRRGRTDLVITSPALAGRPEEQRVSYALDGGARAALAAGPAPNGTGLAIRGDIPRLLAALPVRGEVTFQIASPQATPLEGRYALSSLNTVRNRLAEPCKWPALHPAVPAPSQ
jgi:hypothetical protein